MNQSLATYDANFNNAIPLKLFTQSQGAKAQAALGTSRKRWRSRTPSSSEDDSDNEGRNILVTYQKDDTLDPSTFCCDFNRGLWPFVCGRKVLRAHSVV